MKLKKNLLLCASFVILLLTACSKHETGCTPVEPASEEQQILAYIAKDSMHATRHTSGIYYQIIDTGSEKTPATNSTITVSYTGKLLNGSIFDQNENYTKKLSGLIEGWQIGLPLIKKGGRIKLLIPSVYAYGCNATQIDNAVIPANSILFFDVTLISVQ